MSSSHNSPRDPVDAMYEIALRDADRARHARHLAAVNDRHAVSGTLHTARSYGLGPRRIPVSQTIRPFDEKAFDASVETFKDVRDRQKRRAYTDENGRNQMLEDADREALRAFVGTWEELRS